MSMYVQINETNSEDGVLSLNEAELFGEFSLNAWFASFSFSKVSFPGLEKVKSYQFFYNYSSFYTGDFYYSH